MNGFSNREGSGALPDNIAAAAGLPRAEGIERSLHDIKDRTGAKADATLSSAGDEARDAYDDVRGSADATARRAADAASDFRQDASEAAGTARERVSAAVGDARERASDAYGDARSWASDRYGEQRQRAAELADRGHDRLRRGRTATEDFVSDNPLLVGVVGLAAGLLLGALLPRTRRETETLGPWADEVRDQGLRYARDATRQGREFVERALDPENLDTAVKRASEPADGYEGSERTAHRL